ncbi:MAG: 50S ribosomal protein L10 [Synechococcales cyanobacterium RM1_1_8]|nr:50S ribosomal protein L10 [Synechococcales cyanobacterium RM1_1_8]
MGRTRESKEQLVDKITQELAQAQMALVMDYQGLSVAEITQLRDGLAESGAICTVAKNTLVKKAIAGSEDWSELEQLLQGTNALLLAKGDVGSAIKAYQKFQKATKKTELRGGVFEGKLLSQDQIKAIGDLPSKEELIAQIAGAINGVATQLARGINEIPTGLARAIKALSEKEDAA